MIGYLCGSVTSGPKKSKLMNSIMACDEAREESVFLSALNASLAHFVHKTLKDEQVECIRRIACHGRDVLAVLPTGFGKSRHISVDSKGRDPFNQNSNRSDREKRTTSKGGPVFSQLFRLDRTDPLSFGPKFPEILVEWIAPKVLLIWAVQPTPYQKPPLLG